MIRAILPSLLLAALATPSSAQEMGSHERGFYGGDYQIISRMNDLCLNVSGGRIHEGAVLITWDCVGADNERFRAERVGPDGDMRLTIAGRDGLFCVDTPWQQGQQLRLARCQSGSPAQTWRFTGREPFAIRGAYGFCINIEGQRQTRGTRVIAWRCSDEPNEAWTFNPVR